MANAGADRSYEKHRNELGRLLRKTLSCPRQHDDEAMLGMLNPHRDPLRIVAWRTRSIRLECRDCGLRFSIDTENLADVIVAEKAPSEAEVEARARADAAADPGMYLEILASHQQRAEAFRRNEREKILGPHRRALAAAKPRKRQTIFPEA